MLICSILLDPIILFLCTKAQCPNPYGNDMWHFLKYRKRLFMQDQCTCEDVCKSIICVFHGILWKYLIKYNFAIKDVQTMKIGASN